jgi:hypothetical protein
MKRFFTLITIVISAHLYAQQCATHDVYLKNISTHPKYEQAVVSAFEQAKEWASQNGWKKSGGVYQIPVVVHILHMNAAQNLDDSLVHNQIDVLDEDFRRLNADTALTRNEFKPIAADAQIEFYLATIDPDGNPTNGITRTVGTPAFGTYTPFDDNAKFDSLGGKTAWPTNRYLNIWVCDLVFGFGILGYAYPPVGNVPNWDPGVAPLDPGKQGVVIHYAVFGRNNPNASGPLSMVNRGRTVTHEVGHYLGLRHVWGDGDCTMDDGIQDTPDASDNAQQICDWTKNTCTETSGPELPDNIENFMDYASDSCMNMFTEGQVTIMRYILEEFRPELIGLPASINEYENIQQLISVYPNPAITSVEIRIHSSLKMLNTEIVDTQGAVIYSADKSHVSVQSLRSGIYFIRVYTNQGTITKKLVKQ